VLSAVSKAAPVMALGHGTLWDVRITISSVDPTPCRQPHLT
jgi:hypothetical protein